MPDRGGQRKQALADPGTDSVDAARAMQFEVERGRCVDEGLEPGTTDMQLLRMRALNAT